MAGSMASRTRLRRRLSWYLVGFLIILAMVWVDPNVGTDLYVGLGDKGEAVLLGIALRGRRHGPGDRASPCSAITASGCPRSAPIRWRC